MIKQNGKAFLASVSPEPRERCQSQVLPCQELALLATAIFPAQKHFTTPPCLEEALGRIVCLEHLILLVLCSFLCTTCALLLISCQWGLFQNYLFLRCLYMKELGNPGSRAWLLFWCYILSHTNGLKSCEVHLCSNFIVIQLICWTDGHRFKCPGCSLLAWGCRAGQVPSTSQTMQETKRCIISQSQDKVSLSSKSNLQNSERNSSGILFSLQETRRQSCQNIQTYS